MSSPPAHRIVAADAHAGARAVPRVRGAQRRAVPRVRRARAVRARARGGDRFPRRGRAGAPRARGLRAGRHRRALRGRLRRTTLDELAAIAEMPDLAGAIARALRVTRVLGDDAGRLRTQRRHAHRLARVARRGLPQRRRAPLVAQPVLDPGARRRRRRVRAAARGVRVRCPMAISSCSTRRWRTACAVPPTAAAPSPSRSRTATPAASCSSPARCCWRRAMGRARRAVAAGRGARGARRARPDGGRVRRSQRRDPARALARAGMRRTTCHVEETSPAEPHSDGDAS
jgi:hypothetical protein